MVAPLERAFRDDRGRVVAALVGLLGDVDLAEDAVQEAFAIAAGRWGRDGVPADPRGWLMRTARNRAIDRIRRERRLARLLPLLERPEAAHDDHDPPAMRDERLELVFMCCHPALAVEAQVALTLRTLGGLTTAEIARAFLVPEATMAQRLVRAKRTITVAGIPFRMPPPELLDARRDAVLAVVYLVFNQGYSGRDDLVEEALWLGRALAELMPRDPEVHGLLALMLLHDARSRARFRDGERVLLEDQDRTLWDAGRLAEGRAALARAHALGGGGPHVLQAGIAALHAEDPRDRAGIAALYDALLERSPTPVVALSRAVARAEVDGPEAGLALMEGLDLPGYPYLHAARGEMLRRLGRTAEAREALERARDLTRDPADVRLLERRLAALGQSA